MIRNGGARAVLFVLGLGLGLPACDGGGGGSGTIMRLDGGARDGGSTPVDGAAGAGGAGGGGGGTQDGSAGGPDGTMDTRDAAPTDIPIRLDVAGPVPDALRDGVGPSGDTRDSASGDALADRPADVFQPVTIEQVCAEYGARACERLNACVPWVVQLRYGTVATCATRYRIACIIASSAPGARVFAGPLAECANGFAAASCSDVLNNQVFESCFRPGQRPSGARCATSSQCQSGYCRLELACGVCANRLSAGAKCVSDLNDDRQCAQGSVCANDVCVMAGTAGQACNPTQPCQRPLACIGGICATALTLNATCSSTPECDTLANLVCNKQGGADRGRCQSRGVLANNARCTALGSPCVGSGACSPTTQRCVPPAADGFGCGPKFENRNCLPPARCLDEMCQLPSPATCQ